METKPNEPVKSDKQSVDEFLTILREFFFTAEPIYLRRSSFQSERCRNVWNIITALRGPDQSGGVDDKWAITTVIRYKVFGSQSQVDENADIEPDHEGKVQIRRSISPYGHVTETDGHFIAHAKHAFEALGLSWTELNHIE